MEQEIKEFNQALRGLSAKVRESVSIAMDTRHAMSKLINESHLKTTLTMLREDFVLRRDLERGFMGKRNI